MFTQTGNEGATIILQKGTRELPLEQLTQYGVTDLDIPWKRLVLNNTQTLVAQEQQIIVLGEGDRLETLTGLDVVTDPVTNISTISIKYSAQQISSAK